MVKEKHDDHCHDSGYQWCDISKNVPRIKDGYKLQYLPARKDRLLLARNICVQLFKFSHLTFFSEIPVLNHLWIKNIYIEFIGTLCI